MEEREESRFSANDRPKRKHRPGLSRNQAACVRCQRRKHKCDGELPACSACRKAGEQCIASRRFLPQGQSEGHVESLQILAQQLQSQVAKLEAELAIERQRNSGSEATLTSSLANVPLPRTNQGSSSLSTYATGNSSLHGSLSLHEGESFSNDGQDNQLNLEGQDSGPRPTRIPSAKLLQPTFNATTNIDRSATGSMNSAWRLCHENSPDQESSESRDLARLPSERLGEDLVNTFFSHRWPSLPCLHKPSFLERCYRPLMNGERIDPVSAFLAYMVFAIGAIDLKRVEPDGPFSHSDYFNIAVKNYLDSLLLTEDIRCVQGLLLLSAYGMNEPQTVNVWFATGLALRMAIDLGMHRNTINEQPTLLEAQRRSRVFWCVYVMDRSVSIALGRPLGIRDADIDMEMPLVLTDEDLVLGAISPTSSQRGVPNPSDTSTFIHIIRLRQITATIQEAFGSVAKGSRPENYYEDLRNEIHDQLDIWITSAPRYPRTVSTFQSIEWFQIAYHHAILSLHRPSLAWPRVSHEDLQICSDSSISLISSYGALYAKNRIAYTFVALYSLFMASVTMLYTLRASSKIRQGTTKAVVHTNVLSCLNLFEGISQSRAVGKRCSSIIERLGKATLVLFEPRTLEAGRSLEAGGGVPEISIEQADDIDMEFLTWFGLKMHPDPNSQLQEDPTAPFRPHGADNPVDTSGLDAVWGEYFDQGFDFNLPVGVEFFDSAVL
jgi:hypothetical protein